MAEQNRRKAPAGEYVPREVDDILICRCEEVSKGDIRRAIHAGLRTMNEIKRETRLGMGLCQGQTCTRIARGFIARELGIAPGEVGMPTPRTPARPVAMPVIARDGIMDDPEGEKEVI